MKRLLFYFLPLCTVLCLAAYKSKAQTPVVSLSSSGNCTGNTLTVNSNMNPAIVIWKLNGSVVQTTSASWNSNGVTVAGGNGPGIAANQLYNPFNAFVDASGNIYIADQYNYRVQKWAPGASVGSTVAGGNGYGPAANQLSYLSGVYADASGNVYVADYNNARVQKWAPSATSGTTVAGGNGTGPASNQLYDPYGVDIDAAGNLYVADYMNARIQKWAAGASSGTTVAGGNGTGPAANQLNGPQGFARDANNNIYIADQYNSRIQKWAAGASTGVTIAGGNGAGVAANQLDNPTQTWVDGAGNVYIADQNNNRIQFWPPGATTGITVAGSSTGLQGSTANFLNRPTGVFVDSNGNMYVSDYVNNRIQRFTPNSSINNTYLPTAPGSYTATVVTFKGTQATTSPIVISASPTITLGASPAVCAGSTSAGLPYTATSGNPNAYTVVYDATAISAGFSNVSNATLTSSSIQLSVPAGIAAGSYNATISVSSGGSCVSTPQNFTIGITSGVSSPSISISANTSATVCAGTNVTFTAVAVNGGNSPFYQWKINGNAAGTNSTNFSSSSLNNGDNVTCVLTSNAACITTNTATSNSISFIVNALPSMSLTNSNPTVCPGTLSVGLPFVASGSPNHYSVGYSPAALNAGFSNVNNAAFTSSPIMLPVPASIATGNYTGTITVSNAAGCSSITQNFTITVTTGTIPTINSVSNQAVCSGSTTTLITFGGSSVSGTSYLWTNNDTSTGLGANGSNIIPAFTAIDNDSLPKIDTIIVTPSANGCNGTPTSFTIRVNPIPKLSSSLTPPSICSGTPFSYTPGSGTPGTTFSWSRAAIAGISNPAGSGSNNPNEILNNTTTFSIGVVYVDTLRANSCMNTELVVVFVKPMTAGPVINIRPSNIICSGTTPQNFGTTVAPPSGGYYVWTATNAVVWGIGAGGQNCLVIFPNTGTSVVTLTSVPGSSQCPTRTSDTLTVGNATAFNDTVIYHHNQFVCLDNIADTYQWGYDNAVNLQSTVLIGEVNQNYINSYPDTLHNYYWVIITHGGCTQKLYYKLPPTGPAGVNNIASGETSMTLYPNPASDIMTIEMNLEQGTKNELRISDLSGKIIMSTPVNNSKTQIDIGGISAGFYIISSYSNGNRVSSARLIKN